MGVCPLGTSCISIYQRFRPYSLFNVFCNIFYIFCYELHAYAWKPYVRASILDDALYVRVDDF